MRSISWTGESRSEVVYFKGKGLECLVFQVAHLAEG